MLGGAAVCMWACSGELVSSSLTCFTPSRLLLFNAKLCPVLQIRPELIGRDAELPTATGVIAAALDVVLPILFFWIPFGVWLCVEPAVWHTSNVVGIPSVTGE